MRISDWSSDVCSSDLTFQGGYDAWRGRDPPSGPGVLAQGDRIVAGGTGPAVCRSNDLGRHRAEVVQGLVAVRATAEVDLGDGVDALRAGSVDKCGQLNRRSGRHRERIEQGPATRRPDRKPMGQNTHPGATH